MNEDNRQIFHVFLGLASMFLVLFFGITIATYTVGIILCLGLVLVHLKLSNVMLGPLERLINAFERPGVTPGYGAMTIAAATLAILTLLVDINYIMASLIILGFGDAASSYFGRRSKKKLFYSRNKTIGGTAAFFLACIPAVYFAGWWALAVAGAAALAESLESRVDDNLVIAVVCVIGFRLV